MKRIICILASVLTLASCTPQLDESPEMLVVEGWIENDAAPVVFVTSSVSTSFDQKDVTDLISHIALNATVSITYDSVKYPLTPTVRDEYLLKICYTTNALKGTIGGQYTLNVDWNGKHAQAVTSILQPGSVDSITIEQMNDTAYIVKARVQPVPQVRYYRFFSKAVDKDPTFAPSYIGLFDSRLNDDLIAVNRGGHSPIEQNDYFYALGDSVVFKLASMDDTAYDFWSKFEENVMFSHTALLPYATNLKSNIDGGLGYFFGYGITTYTTKINAQQ